MREIQNIWDDIKNKRYIEAYIVFILSIIILGIDIFGKNDEYITEIILASLSVLIYLNIKERREYYLLIKSRDIDGISAFHTSRHKMQNFDEVIGSAKKEIFLYAVKHSVIVHQYLGLLEAKAKSGCKIFLLLLAARDQNGDINPNVRDVDYQRNQGKLLPVLEANTEALLKWYGSLEPSIKENVEIRSYMINPTVTYTFIDKDESDGWVQVEIFIPSVSLFDLPHYIVRRKENEDYFVTYIKSLEGVLNQSKLLT